MHQKQLTEREQGVRDGGEVRVQRFTGIDLVAKGM